MLKQTVLKLYDFVSKRDPKYYKFMVNNNFVRLYNDDECIVMEIFINENTGQLDFDFDTEEVMDFEDKYELLDIITSEVNKINE